MPRIIEGKEMNLIGDRLRVLRKKHHLSQQQLSERLETQAVYIVLFSHCKALTY